MQYATSAKGGHGKIAFMQVWRFLSLLAPHHRDRAFIVIVGLRSRHLWPPIWAPAPLRANRTQTIASNFRSHSACAGHAGAVTRLPSARAWSTGTSLYTPPARVISGPTAQ